MRRLSNSSPSNPKINSRQNGLLHIQHHLPLGLLFNILRIFLLSVTFCYTDTTVAQMFEVDIFHALESLTLFSHHHLWFL